jgi:hypothetical protein
MHATLKRRVERLEERSGAGSKPRKALRIVLRRLDGTSSLENAGCTRTLCPNGTLIEMVRLDRCRGNGVPRGAWVRGSEFLPADLKRPFASFHYISEAQ